MGITFFRDIKQCAAKNLTITCDFALYSNATSLQDDQKLLPNTDITGKKVIKVFLITTYFAIFAAILLLVDELHLLQTKQKLRTDSGHRSKLHGIISLNFYRRLMHTIDSILHHFSDLQLMSGLALFVAACFDDCGISAYHFNIVCLLLLLALLTHAVALVTIPKFYAKHGWQTGALRVAGIFASLILTGIMYRYRITTDFPVEPSSKAILAASCFGDLSSAGANVSTSGNLSETLGSVVLATSSGEAAFQFHWLYIPTAVIIALGTLYFGAASTKAFDSDDIDENVWLDWLTFTLRLVFTVIAAIVAITAGIKYNWLRSGMEKPEWYVVAKEVGTTFSQILAAALLSSSVLNVFKALDEEIKGPRKDGNANSVAAARFMGNALLKSDDNEMGPDN